MLSQIDVYDDSQRKQSHEESYLQCQLITILYCIELSNRLHLEANKTFSHWHQSKGHLDDGLDNVK